MFAQVDVILTSGGPVPAHAAKNATTTIPIVFIAGDPIGGRPSFAHLVGSSPDSPLEESGFRTVSPHCEKGRILRARRD